MDVILVEEAAVAGLARDLAKDFGFDEFFSEGVNIGLGGDAAQAADEIPVDDRLAVAAKEDPELKF